MSLQKSQLGKKMGEVFLGTERYCIDWGSEEVDEKKAVCACVGKRVVGVAEGRRTPRHTKGGLARQYSLSNI